jgi:hypothetical protein
LIIDIAFDTPLMILLSLLIDAIIDRYIIDYDIIAISFHWLRFRCHFHYAIITLTYFRHIISWWLAIILIIIDIDIILIIDIDTLLLLYIILILFTMPLWLLIISHYCH